MGDFGIHVLLDSGTAGLCCVLNLCSIHRLFSLTFSFSFSLRRSLRRSTSARLRYSGPARQNNAEVKALVPSLYLPKSHTRIQDLIRLDLSSMPIIRCTQLPHSVATLEAMYLKIRLGRRFDLYVAVRSPLRHGMAVFNSPPGASIHIRTSQLSTRATRRTATSIHPLT